MPQLDYPISINKNILFPIIHGNLYPQTYSDANSLSNLNVETNSTTSDKNLFTIQPDHNKKLPLYFRKKTESSHSPEGKKSILHELRGPANIWNLYGLSNLNDKCENEPVKVPPLELEQNLRRTRNSFESQSKSQEPIEEL